MQNPLNLLPKQPHMKTPDEIKRSLKTGVVTPEILALAIYSLNKRAKNMRDKEHMLRSRGGDYYDNEGKAREKKGEYYKKKEELLRYLQPSEIHHVIRECSEKIYDHEQEYFSIDEKEVIREGSYYDKYEGEVVRFKVVKRKHVEKYLFYNIGDYSFHTPLNGEESGYNLPITELDDLTTYGHDITDLLSVQMCDRIISGLRDGTMSYSGASNGN